MRAMRPAMAAAVAAVALTSAGAGVSHAATTASIDPRAKLAPDGAVVVQVRVRCDPGLETLEAHVSVSQDDQTVFGMAGMGLLRCDGRRHKYRVTVVPQEGAFHRGDAYSNVFVLRYDEATGATESADVSRILLVR
jgi:hypothetical protein